MKIPSDSDGIVIERGNMTLERNGFWIEGSGTGTHALILARHDYNVAGIDVSKDAQNQAHTFDG